VRQQDRYAVREAYQRRGRARQPYRNGYYERDFVTRFDVLRLRIARTWQDLSAVGTQAFSAALTKVDLLSAAPTFR
jgi:hypothetical protein